MRTARPSGAASSTTTAVPCARPPSGPPADWVIACSRHDLARAATMPVRVEAELTHLLEIGHGGQAPVLAKQAAALVTRLRSTGAQGRLRLSGSRGRVLIEILDRSPARPEAEPTRAGGGEQVPCGWFRTRAEVRSERVTWACLALPDLPRAGSASSTADPDVWT